mmetsp:Transcript_9891/g.23277  ORF Transcript_9891/g.23277 Transcript_9891/m.23277 type:complete len:186 (-) Transcript_9891:41-598(-)
MTCTILGWDTTSVAHALAASETDTIPRDSKSNQSDVGPLDHWKALIQLLQSIPAIEMPQTLLCLPGIIGKRDISIGRGGTSRSTEDTDSHTQQQQVRLDPFSVSVHAPCENFLASNKIHSEDATSSRQSLMSSSSAVTIGLDRSILDQAGAVVLADQALRDCRRDWEWNRLDQVPNTYPVADTIE